MHRNKCIVSNYSNGRGLDRRSCEHRASSLLVKAEIRSQKIQMYTGAVSGELFGPATCTYMYIAGYWTQRVRLHSSGCGQHSTDHLAHFGYKCTVSCHFRDKRMCLKPVPTVIVEIYMLDNELIVRAKIQTNDVTHV